MRFLLFSAFFFLLMIPLVLGIIIPTIRSHRKTTGKTVNYDAMMRVFMYRIQMSETEKTAFWFAMQSRYT